MKIIDSISKFHQELLENKVELIEIIVDEKGFDRIQLECLNSSCFPACNMHLTSDNFQFGGVKISFEKIKEF